MARIAHLSDIHFGAHDPKIVAATETWLQQRQPELIIISGDLTQRAKTHEFRQASAYLNRLRAFGFRLLVVPGNHDVPLLDVFRRIAAPLDRYKKYIDDDLFPWFENDEVAVLGINTARSLTIKDGRINHVQIAIIQERFAPVAPSKTRILVTHHPLYALPMGEGGEFSEAVGRHRDATKAVCQTGVHIALAGHSIGHMPNLHEKWWNTQVPLWSCRPAPPPPRVFETMNFKASTGFMRTETTKLNYKSFFGTVPGLSVATTNGSSITEQAGLRRLSQRGRPMPEWGSAATPKRQSHDFVLRHRHRSAAC